MRPVRPGSTADLLLIRGVVHTLDADLGTVEAIAVAGGRVLALGTSDSLRSLADRHTEIVSVQGKVVMPGLTDSHLHLQQLAFQSAKVNCETESLEACLSRVAERCRHAPAGAWILGHGWDDNRWATRPDRWSLDRVSPNHPVYLSAKSLHAGWANSAALAAAGLSRESVDPPGGTLHRSTQGDLTGLLAEGAMRLIERAIPQPGPEDIVRQIGACQESLWAVGITAVHDFDGIPSLDALQTMRDRGQLGLRVLKAVPLEALDVAAASGLRSGEGDEWLRIGAVKVFADGALGPRTAAMLAPYEREPENVGCCLHDRHSLFGIGRRALTSGFSMAVHAIGDRANREVLAGFDLLQRDPRLPPPRMPHRIEHVQLLHPDDIGGLARLGLVASMQPIHAPSDMPTAERYWGTRTRTSYAWRSLEQTGASLIFGSDAPVESPNPFWGLHAAVTRRRQDGSPGPEGWIPEQRLSRAAALRAYTVAPAAVTGRGGVQGTLRPGALADLIILDQDPLTCPEDDLREIRPVATMVAGVWRIPSF